ncbi:MAG: laccase domain-containing protein, partial [Sarcina sp.]
RCCYQVSDELQKKFVDKFGEEVSENRMLNLEKCIEKQIKDFDYIKNIENVNICTYCEEDLELYSYRKKGEYAGRLFSFIYVK